MRRAFGFLCLLVVSSGAAELPSARLETIFPPGGSAGAETEVAITGADLDDAKELHFTHPGITAVAKDKRFLVKIAPEVPPGIYDVRAAGALGISNPRAFVVGEWPQTTKTAANGKPEAALDLALDSSIVGTATAAAADFFKITAKKGQHVIVECATAEIDSRLRPVLTASDLAGHDLAMSRRGGVVDFIAPADGAYLLRLHDVAFSGGPQHFYLLTARTGPRLDFVLPPCAQPGAKAKLTLYGRNLPQGAPSEFPGYEKLTVEIDVPKSGDASVEGLNRAEAVGIDGFSYRLKSSNPVFIGFASGPVVAEQEKVTPPCEIAGQFFPAADSDTFTFDAKKGEVWWIEVISQRLGLPTSPFLLVQDVEAYASDASAGGPRFRTASGDPATRFEAKADGPVRVIVRDLFGETRSDPRCVYRLVIRRESPDFSLVALAEPPLEKKDDRTAAPRAALLRAGGTVAIKVLAIRRDGFAGEIELRAEALPPGVECVPQKILAGASEGVLLLAGDAKPPRWAGAIRVIGKSGDLTREARGGAVRWTVADFNTEAVQSRFTGDIALAVSAEPAPVSISAENKQCEVAAGAKLEIPLKIARHGDFKEALKLKAAGAPGIEAWKEIDIAPTATETKATIDLAAVKLPPGEHTIHFEAQTKGKFRGKDVITTVFSTPIRITVR